MRTESRTLALCAAVPPLALVAFTAVALLATPLWGHPMWHAAPLNMSEAAAARDVATIAAMLERGEDPDAVRHVRPPLLKGAVRRDLTPLEAAVVAGRLEVVHLLLTRGATAADDARLDLACRAQASGYRDVAEYLAGEHLSAGCP